MMFGWHDGWDWAMTAVDLVFGVLVVTAVVFGIVFSARHGGAQHSPDGGRWSSSQARAILEERFARGEIDEKEFRERSESLRR